MDWKEKSKLIFQETKLFLEDSTIAVCLTKERSKTSNEI